MLGIKALICIALAVCASGAAVPAAPAGPNHYYLELSNPDFHTSVHTGSHNVSSPIIFDTGSYSLYVNNYNYLNSSSVKDLNQRYSAFVAGYNQGEMIEDVIWFDEHAPAIRAQYGVNDPTPPGSWGIFGLARGNAEPNYVQQLHIDGLINKGAFSVWYDSDKSYGEISFGTYDKAKYQGPLAKFVSPTGSFWTVPTGGIITPDGKSHYQNQTVLLDTGNEGITLPESVLREIQKSLNGSTYEEDGHYISYPKCQFTDDQKLSFVLGEAVVEVNLRDASYPYDNKCALLLATTSQSPPTFGAPFLSSAFTIFDIDSASVLVGARNYTDEVDIQVIE